jgi:hypothetical protein
MKTAEQFWKEKTGKEPQNASERLAIFMMVEYALYVYRENASESLEEYIKSFKEEKK